MVTSTEAINALSGNNQISTDGQILESRQEDHPNRPTSLGDGLAVCFQVKVKNLLMVNILAVCNQAS